MADASSFVVAFETTKGTFKVTVRPEWAPRGAERLRTLVEEGFYDGARFFRVLEGFVAQFGLNGDPEVNAMWRERTIEDDPVATSNVRGTVVYATAGPGTRTTQLFINFGNNSMLDGQGFSPIGEITEGMEEVVDQLYNGYGEGAPQGRGPSQHLIQMQGNAYLEADFPDLDYIKKATIEA